MCRDASIRAKVERIFNIWEERQVYNKEFVAQLRAALGMWGDGLCVRNL